MFDGCHITVSFIVLTVHASFTCGVTVTHHHEEQTHKVDDSIRMIRVSRALRMASAQLSPECSGVINHLNITVRNI